MLIRRRSALSRLIALLCSSHRQRACRSFSLFSHCRLGSSCYRLGSSCYRSVRRMLRKERRYSVAIPGDFRPCCVEHTCLVSQLLSGIAVRFRSSYRGGHARASPSRSIRVRQASRLHKDCITTSCCRNRFDVSCSVMFVVAIIFFLLGTTTIHEST